jgi:uncharacterized protein YndB with AHSA1/START domain
MTEADPTGDGTAVVRRVLPAPPDVVYDEWLDPEALADFVCPHPTTAGPIEVDARLGGRLLITMVDPGSVVEITGEYLELERPRRLRFTWNSGYGGGFRSIVTVTLEPYGDEQTHMTIEHTQLPARFTDDHQRGWTIDADQLERRLGRRAEPGSR